MKQYTPIQAQTLQQIVGKIAQLKVMPQVVYQVLANTESDFGSAAAIEKAISVDPGFSAKVLGMANSAYYALPKKVTSVRDAVMLLGFKNLREIAMNASVMDMFIGKTDEESLRRRDWWKSSVDTGTVCRWLAERDGSVSPHMAYTCGLLHMIGKTILDQHNPAQFAKALNAIANGTPILEAEREAFHVDHIDVGCAIVAQWGFEEAIVETLDYQNEPDDPHNVPATRAMVAMAHLMVEHYYHPNHGFLDTLKSRTWCWTRLGYSESTLEPIVTEGCKVFGGKPQAA